METPSWFRNIIKPLPAEKRKAVVSEVMLSASPGFDFFLLVVLSCSIATAGLITDSPAVIIGAMLVAPLMSPLIGIGLASITGDANLLRSSISALLRGALLAVTLAMLITIVNIKLPFFNIQELPKEILVRTRPTPIDLVIAMAGGIAAAYAMTQPNISAALPGVAIATALMPPLCTIGIGIALNRWDVAGGATLLFITNAVAIAFASALVFFLRGFSAATRRKNGHIPRNLILEIILVILLLIPLSYFSVRFFREAAANRTINEIVSIEVSKLDGAELVELDVNRNGLGLDMVATIRTSSALHYEQVVGLQKTIVDGIHQPVALKINQIIAEKLDPLIPPTLTYTPTLTLTSTPGPSPTATITLTPTSTSSPTPTLTLTSTVILPSSTPTASSTPATAEIQRYLLPALRMYQRPGGPSIGNLIPGQKVTVLAGNEMYGGFLWIEIQDADGRVGWIPEVYLRILLPTSTPTRTPTPTSPTDTPTLSPSQTPTISTN